MRYDFRRFYAVTAVFLAIYGLMSFVPKDDTGYKIPSNRPCIEVNASECAVKA